MLIVLTQVSPRVQALAGRLDAAGHHSLVLSHSELIRAPEAPAPQALMEAIGRVSHVVVVSPGALQFLCADLLTSRAGAAADWAWPAHCRLALIGPGSREALVALRQSLPVGAEGLLPEAHAAVVAAGPPFDGEHLARLPAFAGDGAADDTARERNCQTRGEVLVIQGQGAPRPWIGDLAASGRRVTIVPLYGRRAIEPGPAVFAQLSTWFDTVDPPALCWSFSQSEAVTACTRWLGARGALARAQAGRAFANHPRVLDSLQLAGWTRAALIDPGEAALRRALESPP